MESVLESLRRSSLHRVGTLDTSRIGYLKRTVVPEKSRAEGRCALWIHEAQFVAASFE